MKKLYFIRHGQSQLNVDGKYAGQTETPLTAEGRNQAKQAGIDAKKNNVQIDLIVSSPLSRAHETAQIFAKEVGYPEDKIIVDERFIERHFGDLEAQPWSPDHTVEYRHRFNIETDDQLVARTHKALDWLKTRPEENILVSSHGSFGRALRSILKEEFSMELEHRIGNAELIELL